MEDIYPLVKREGHFPPNKLLAIPSIRSAFSPILVKVSEVKISVKENYE